MSDDALEKITDNHTSKSLEEIDSFESWVSTQVSSSDSKSIADTNTAIFLDTTLPSSIPDLKHSKLDDFITTIKTNRQLAYKIALDEPDSIISIINSYESFLELTAADAAIAIFLLKKSPIEWAEYDNSSEYYEILAKSICQSKASCARFSRFTFEKNNMSIYESDRYKTVSVIDENIVFLALSKTPPRLNFSSLEMGPSLMKIHLYIADESHEFFPSLVKSKKAMDVVKAREDFMHLAQHNFIMAFSLLTSFPDRAPVKYRDIAEFAHFYMSRPGSLDHKYLKKIHLDKLDYLDLAEKKNHDAFSAIPKKTRLNLRFTPEKKTEISRENHLRCHFPSMKSFFFKMMYGDSGFYNKIKFTSADDPPEAKGDFTTFNTNRFKMQFAASIAYQLFLQAGDKDRPFRVLECGGGDGSLFINIISIVRKMKDRDIKWNKFYHRLHYQLVEISPMLRALQEENIKKKVVPEFKNITFKKGDARSLDETDIAEVDALISNELVDMFPPHYFRRNRQGGLDVKLLIPSINKTLLEKHFLQESKLSMPELEESSNYHKFMLREMSLPKDTIVLSETDYLKIHAVYAKMPQLKKESIFEFQECFVNSRYFKEITQFIKTHQPYFDTLCSPTEERGVSPDISSFMKGAKRVLAENGIVITVDYGNALFDPKHLRTFGLGVERGSHYYKKSPGFIDLTLTVPFPVLVAEGERFGLTEKFYGNQSHLLSTNACKLFLEHKVLDETMIENYRKRLPSNAAFKVCVQVNGPKETCPLDFSEPSIQIGYGHLFNQNKNKMKEIFKASALSFLKETTSNQAWQWKDGRYHLCGKPDNLHDILDFLRKNKIPLEYKENSKDDNARITIQDREVHEILAIGPAEKKTNISVPG